MSYTVPRVAASTRAEDCYQLLKTAILNLDLPMGLLIDEIELARQLGVSKTPVREALLRLSAEGLIKREAGHRSRVTELSFQSIHDIFELRLILECGSIRRVAPQISDQDIDHLEVLVSDSEAAPEDEDVTSVLGHSHEFHMYLIALGKNERLTHMFQSIFDEMNRIHALIHRSQQILSNFELRRRGIANHRRILEALRLRNPELAAKALEDEISLYMRASMDPEMQAVFKSLSSIEEQDDE